MGDFFVKTFYKHWHGVKITVSLFKEVFQVGDHPLWLVTVLWGRWPPIFGRPPLYQAGLTPPKEKLLLKEDGHQPKRTVTIHWGRSQTSKTFMKMLTFILTPPWCLLNILAQKLSRNWVKAIDVICMNRAIQKCTKLTFQTYRKLRNPPKKW